MSIGRSEEPAGPSRTAEAAAPVCCWPSATRPTWPCQRGGMLSETIGRTGGTSSFDHTPIEPRKARTLFPTPPRLGGLLKYYERVAHRNDSENHLTCKHAVSDLRGCSRSRILVAKRVHGLCGCVLDLLVRLAGVVCDFTRLDRGHYPKIFASHWCEQEPDTNAEPESNYKAFHSAPLCAFIHLQYTSGFFSAPGTPVAARCSTIKSTSSRCDEPSDLQFASSPSDCATAFLRVRERIPWT